MPRSTDGLSVPAVPPSNPNLTRPYAEASQRFQTIPKRIPHPMEILQYDTVGENPSILLLDQQSTTIGSDPKSDLFLELGL